jgi:hypothetical protein
LPARGPSLLVCSWNCRMKEFVVSAPARSI